MSHSLMWSPHKSVVGQRLSAHLGEGELGLQVGNGAPKTKSDSDYVNSSKANVQTESFFMKCAR